MAGANVDLFADPRQLKGVVLSLRDKRGQEYSETLVLLLMDLQTRMLLVGDLECQPLGARGRSSIGMKRRASDTRSYER